MTGPDHEDTGPMAAGTGFDVEAAIALITASDHRWLVSDDADPQFDPAPLRRFARALALTLEETPRWLETSTFTGPDGSVEIEVVALGARFLSVVSTPWLTPEARAEPTVRIQALRLLRALEVGGLEYDGEGAAVGCTIRLFFDGGSGIRLGASTGADRSRLVEILPSLRAALDA